MARKSSRGLSYYACRSYTEKKVCSKHSIREDRLENAILAALQMQITLIDQLAEEIERINRAPAVNRENKRLTQALKQAEKRLAQYNDAADKLCLDWKRGEISKEDYDRWRYRYPEFDTTGHWHKVIPSQGLSDLLVDELKKQPGKEK